MIRVRDGDTDWGWGVVVNVSNMGGGIGKPDGYVVDTLLHCAPGAAEAGAHNRPRFGLTSPCSTSGPICSVRCSDC
jgi:ATP-dependent RNA helicase DOB1